MNKFSKYISISTIIHTAIWMILLVTPIIFSSYNDHINWHRVIFEWLRLWPFVLIFAINNWFLFRFIKQKKYRKYFLLTGLLLLVVTSLTIFTPFIHDSIIRYFRFPRIEEPPPAPFESQRILLNGLLGLMVIGLNDAIKMGIQWAQERRQMESLEKENLQNQLEILRNQISPHFFMNTLNNIHALIDFDKEIAKNAVIKLSKLMRVLLYETPENEFTLKKEIDFLNDYIELMNIRLSDNVEIKFDYPDEIPQISLPPLLFISFIENAFKHGIRATQKSFIHIQFAYKSHELHFSIRNSKSSTSEKNNAEGRIGLENARKRFDLLYLDNYNFDIIEDKDTFEVKISIPLK
jgi:sensor histidine kinase YesM